MAVAYSTSIRSGSPLEEALAAIGATGIRKIDLLTIDGWAHVNTRDLADDWDRTVSGLDAALREHDLAPIALNTGVGPQLHARSPEINERRRREIEAMIRLARHYGIGIAAIQPRNADPDRPWEDVLRDCVATLREQVGAGEVAGVTCALELHVRSPFETLHQARRLLEEMPDLPLVYDPSHFVMQGIDVRQTEWLMANARHVHLRDAAPGRLQAPFGEGDVDFDWVLGALEQRGYAGHFSIEYLETGEDDFDVLESAARLHEAITRRFPA